MRRTWLIFWHTYWSHVASPSYLFLLFGLPLFVIGAPLILALVGVGFFLGNLPPTSPLPVGIINETTTAVFSQNLPTNPVPFQLFDSPTTAETALANRHIQGYYHIPASYWQDGILRANYHPDTPLSPEITSTFRQWHRQALRRPLSQPTQQRYLSGPTFIQQTTPQTAAQTPQPTFQTTGDLSSVGIFFVLIYFVRLAGMFTGGHMFGAIASESRNRTIEIMLTTVTAVQFVMGKLAGLICVGLTQLLIWGSIPFLLSRFILEESPAWLQNEHAPAILIMLIAAYLLDQLIGAASGILNVSGGAGPQLFNLLSWATSLALIYAGYFVPRQPDAPLAIATSFLPFTSPIVMPTRLLVSQVPTWQLWLSQLLLWLTLALFLLWLARLVRANMVTNPPRFSWRRWLRQRTPTGAS